METRGGPTPGGQSYQGRPDFEYNNLAKIEGLLQQVITDKTLSYHDSMFKIIIIGDSGNFYPSQLKFYRDRKILCLEETCRE